MEVTGPGPVGPVQPIEPTRPAEPAAPVTPAAETPAPGGSDRVEFSAEAQQVSATQASTAAGPAGAVDPQFVSFLSGLPEEERNAVLDGIRRWDQSRGVDSSGQVDAYREASTTQPDQDA